MKHVRLVFGGGVAEGDVPLDYQIARMVCEDLRGERDDPDDFDAWWSTAAKKWDVSLAYKVGYGGQTKDEISSMRLRRHEYVVVSRSAHSLDGNNRATLVQAVMDDLRRGLLFLKTREDLPDPPGLPELSLILAEMAENPKFLRVRRDLEEVHALRAE